MTTSASFPLRTTARLLLAGLVAGLAGCANVHHVEVGAVPDDYRLRHPIVVSEAQQAIEIPVAMSDAGLAFADRGRVEDFARRFRASGADAIQILLPSGSANMPAAERLSRDIVKVLRHQRIPQNRVFVQPYAAAGLAGPVPIRLAFSTLVARTKPCGIWDADLADTSENRNYTNFGCASQQNLAAQIADPRDLLTPRGVGEVDATQRTIMLDRWRNGERTASDSNLTESDYTW